MILHKAWSLCKWCSTDCRE